MQSRNRSVRRYALCLAFCLAACGDGNQDSGGFERPAVFVKTTPASLRVLTRDLEAIGTARANESVTIAAKVTDTVSKVRFDDGEFVQSGDVLLELTDEEETALLAEAEANVDDTRTQYNRLADLLKQKSVPVSQVDEARARLHAAQARYASIVARLDDRLIKAPFDGILGFRQVSEGSLLTASTPITTLDDVSIIKIDFSLPEVHLGKVKPGQTIHAESSAYPGRQFPAEVKTIGSRVDPITRAATIRAHIDNPERLLRPGMLLRVRLLIGREEVLMVPETALQRRNDSVFVFLVEEGLAKMQAVEVGARQQGWAQVLEGLSAGQLVISEGVIKVRDNAPVRLLNDSPVDKSQQADLRRSPSGQSG